MAGKPVFKNDLTKEYLQVEYIEKGRSAPDIAKEFGCTSVTVLRYLRLTGLKCRPAFRRGDLTGQKFGDLTGISRVPGKRGQKTKWVCRCDCGNELQVMVSRWLSGKTRSCGCKLRGRHNRNYRGTPNISKSYWNAIQRSARDRGLPFTITMQEAEEMFVEQGGRCALTNFLLVPCERRFSSGGWTASLDRVDSNDPRGYHRENLQWVHKDVNRMKWHYEQDYFISLCEAVYKNFKGKKLK